jgi:hypothetical protein
MTALQANVFSCRACVANAEPFGFDFDATGNPKKFPPTIGATGQAKLLFMALCPRPTNNYVLDWCMSGLEKFAILGANQNQDGDNYLESYDKEDFYRPYVEIAAEAYKDRPFNDVATVSDLGVATLERRSK